MKRFIIFGLSMVLFSSCVQESLEPDLLSDSTDSGQSVPLELSLAVDTLESKAIITSSVLPDGSKVGVHLVDGSSSGLYNGRDYSNVLYTYSSGQMTASEEVMLTPTSGSVYAYYPYVEDADITSLPVSALTQTDYMYATSHSGLTFSNYSASLVMNHAMAVASFRIVKGNYSGACKVSQVAVKGSNLYTSATYNGKNGSVSSYASSNQLISSSEGSFTLNTTGTVRNVILIPAPYGTTVTVNINLDGYDRTVDIPSFHPVAGKRYAYTLTVNEKEIVVSNVSVNTWENANSEYNVYITGDTKDIGINWQVNDDGSITVIAIPAIIGESVKEVSYSEGFNVTQTVDEYSGLRTLLLTDITKDIYLSFNGLTSSFFVYNVNIANSGTFNIINSSVDLSLIKSIYVDGQSIAPSHSVSFTSAGEHVVKIIFQNGVTAIPDKFCYSIDVVGHVRIPDYITSIGDLSFLQCGNITSVDLPEGLVEFGVQAFQKCSKLVSINIPEGVSRISEGLFSYCYSLATVSLPENILEIGARAFQNTALTSIGIPQKVSRLCASTFNGCSNLVSVILPNNLKVIEGYVFRNCEKLASLDLPDGITSIDDGAFQDCVSLKSIDLPTSITEVSDYLFYGCTSLESVTMPENVKSIGRSAFSGCGFTSLPSLPNNLQEIGDYAFSDCKFTQLTLPSCMSSITLGDNLFANCKALKKVVFSNSASTFALPEYIFSGCTSLADVSLTPNISGFFEGVFYGCINLKEINIPASVSHFQNYVFGNCNNLTKIIYNRLECPNSASLSLLMFYNKNNQCISSFTLYVPKGAINFDSWLYLGPDVTIVYF